jgi:hypothetical protein
VGAWNPNRRCQKTLCKNVEYSNDNRTASDAALSHNLAEPLTFAQKEALQRAVAKIVVLGAQIGVSADQMILLLESGLTVGELLEYLAGSSRRSCVKQSQVSEF